MNDSCPFCKSRPVTRALRIDCVRHHDGSHVVLKRCDVCAGEVVAFAMRRGDAVDNRGVRDDYASLLTEMEMRDG